MCDKIYSSILLFIAWVFLSIGNPVLAAGWSSLENCKLAGNPTDGDSFTITMGNGQEKRIRLYAVDCPESDDSFPERNAVQAKNFGIAAEAVPAWGKKAQEFTREFLKNGFRVEHCGQDALGRKGMPKRTYALVWNTKGERLDEALVAAGLAFVDDDFMANMPAWPKPDDARNRDDKVDAKEKFKNSLVRLMRIAKKNKAGVWATMP